MIRCEVVWKIQNEVSYYEIDQDCKCIREAVVKIVFLPHNEFLSSQI